MAIYATKITGKWEEAFTKLESISGFEPLGQEDVDSGLITVKQCWDLNIGWLDDVFSDCINISIP